MSLFSLDQLRRLRACLAGCQVRCVVAFRHWNGFLPSRWQQSAKRRDSLSFPRFLERIRARPTARVEAGFAHMIEVVRAAGIDDIAVVSWDNCTTGDLLATLASACQVPDSSIDWQQAPWKNTSLGMEGADLIRMFNHVRARAQGLSSDPLFDSWDRRCDTVLRDFFDQREDVEHVVAANPSLAAELRARLQEQQVALTLVADDFSDWTQALEPAVAPYLVNPICGQLFHAPRAKALTVSALAASELPAKLCGQMRKELERARRSKRQSVRLLPRVARRLRRGARQIRRRVLSGV